MRPSGPVAWLAGTAALSAALTALPGAPPPAAGHLAPERGPESVSVADPSAKTRPSRRLLPAEPVAVGPASDSLEAGPERAPLDGAALATLRTLEAQGPSGDWDLRGATLAVERRGAVEVHRLAQAGTGAGVTPGAPAAAAAAPRRFAGRRPRLSPDGEMVALERPVGGPGESAVVVVDAARGTEIVLPGFAAGELHWSPDGGRLAVVLRVGQHANVFVFDVARTSLYQITESGGGSPRWLGQGSRLIYEAPRREGGFGLFVRDRGGLGAARLFWDEPGTPSPAADGDVV